MSHSPFSLPAIYNRIAAAKAREVVASVEAFAATSDERIHQLPPETVKALFADCWLAPIRADGPLITGTSAAAQGPAGLIYPMELAEQGTDVASDEEPLSEAGTVEPEPGEAAAVETGTVEAGPAASDRLVKPDEECSASAEGAEADAEPAEAGNATPVDDPPGPLPAAPVEETVTASADDPPGTGMSAGAPDAVERPLDAVPDAAALDDGNSSSGGDASAEPRAATGGESVEPVSAAATAHEAAAAGESTSGPAAAGPRRPRASDNPILGMPFEQYLSVVEQLAAAVLARRSGDGAGGVLASECPEAVATLEAHGINGEACLVFLEHLQTRCRRAFGGASRMEARAREAGQRWFQGLGFCREVFVERPEAGDADT